MRKFLTSVCTAVTIALLAVLFAACGAKSYVGTYKFASMSITNVEKTEEYVIGQPWGDDTLTENSYVLEIKEDGTVTLSSTIGGTTSVSGTWKEENGALVITANGYSISGNLDGGKLTMEQIDEGMTTKMVFNKK
ncbi:MAG: hypothetical protein ACI4QN_05175 [Candidatus Coproplasma sp.]